MEPLDHILGRLDELKMSFFSNIADIAKTYKNKWISMVFDGLGKVLGGFWEVLGLFWRPGGSYLGLLAELTGL